MAAAGAAFRRKAPRRFRSRSRYDVVIVGAGPAGLSAALILGRCSRHVLVCDRGGQRNRWARQQNGFLSRDGIDPAEFRRLACEQMAKYETVEIRDVAVAEVQRREDRYAAALADGTRVVARKLLLATGVLDELPPIPGFEAFYGKSAHHCPLLRWLGLARPAAGRLRPG